MFLITPFPHPSRQPTCLRIHGNARPVNAPATGLGILEGD